MVKKLQVVDRKLLFIRFDHLLAALKHARIAAQLRQPDGGLDVGHVALITGEDHIVFPRARLVFAQRVFALPVQLHEHGLMIERIVVKAGNRTPRKRAAFCGSEVLHGMEAERGEVGDVARHGSLIACT